MAAHLARPIIMYVEAYAAIAGEGHVLHDPNAINILRAALDVVCPENNFDPTAPDYYGPEPDAHEIRAATEPQPVLSVRGLHRSGGRP